MVTFRLLQRLEIIAHVSLTVLVHDVILSSGEDSTPTVAARRASLFALDALEGDATFIIRTCDCRTVSKKKQKKAGLDDVMRDFEDDPSGNDTLSGNAVVPEIEFEEGMIVEE
jgi:endoribonuclease Dicer